MWWDHGYAFVRVMNTKHPEKRAVRRRDHTPSRHGPNAAETALGVRRMRGDHSSGGSRADVSDGAAVGVGTSRRRRYGSCLELGSGVVGSRAWSWDRQARRWPPRVRAVRAAHQVRQRQQLLELQHRPQVGEYEQRLIESLAEEELSEKLLSSDVRSRERADNRQVARTPSHLFHDARIPLRIKNALIELPELDAFGQRLVVIFSDYLSDLIVLDIIDRIESVQDVSAVVIGFLLAYALADLSSGVIYTFFGTMVKTDSDRPRDMLLTDRNSLASETYLDTISDKRNSIREIQIWKDDFFARTSWSCAAVTPLLSLVAGWQPENLGFETLCVMYLSFLAILPQLRAWSVADKPPLPVRVLQRLGVLARAPAGAAAPLCCVSGWWEPLFDMASVPVGRSSRASDAARHAIPNLRRQPLTDVRTRVPEHITLRFSEYD
ncbi:hypothetical protein FVE85_8128 [Porphyridium purpureum]|uniref:Uncharacterized protein n=1 Tax=Porphyridium purpureum TaxID=35688 RepID=A0A5J4YMB1_PORPP|nr:hypothetical protein FVE85_8128 [Porphyridium purpureum]|eukprot:POR7397..scf295_9